MYICICKERGWIIQGEKGEGEREGKDRRSVCVCVCVIDRQIDVVGDGRQRGGREREIERESERELERALLITFASFSPVCSFCKDSLTAACCSSLTKASNSRTHSSPPPPTSPLPQSRSSELNWRILIPLSPPAGLVGCTIVEQ